MTYELEGKLIVKEETQQVSETFRKRQFVVEKEETVGTSVFKDQILFQLTQDKVTMLDSYSIGENVLVGFNIRGRGWKKDEQSEIRYFNNLEAWRLTHAAKSETAEVSVDTNVEIPTEEDDLPF
jgi:hypothetical protein